MYAQQLPPQFRRKRKRVQMRWDSDRAEVGWRWTWLQLRMQLVDRELALYDKCDAELERQKESMGPSFEGQPPGPPVIGPGPVIPTSHAAGAAAAAAAAIAAAEAAAEADGDTGCARARALIRPFKHRKLLKGHSKTPRLAQASFRGISSPLSHSDPNAIRARSALLDRGFHLVLSLPSEAPAVVLGRARAHRRQILAQRGGGAAMTSMSMNAPKRSHRAVAVRPPGPLSGVPNALPNGVPRACISSSSTSTSLKSKSAEAKLLEAVSATLSVKKDEVGNGD